jgi:ketosteroid isomerase-like protein
MTTSTLHYDVTPTTARLLVDFYAAVGRGDLATAFELLSDDIEWRVHRPSPSAGTYHGKQELLDWFGRMAAPYEGTLRVSAPAMVANGQYGFVLVNESAERPAQISYTGVHAWQFADGKICRFESYYDESYSDFWSAQSV